MVTRVSFDVVLVEPARGRGASLALMSLLFDLIVSASVSLERGVNQRKINIKSCW